jgi:hypothetical protein
LGQEKREILVCDLVEADDVRLQIGQDFLVDIGEAMCVTYYLIDKGEFVGENVESGDAEISGFGFR